MSEKAEYTLSVDNAGGPIQLNLMNNKRNSGRRLLGSKGSPFHMPIKTWQLSKEDLKNLIKEMREVLK